jgi:hypothetical protein
MSTIPSSTALKAQAKRLRSALAKLGAQLSHSHCLEAIAAVHGQRDWNTLHAGSKRSLKLWLVYCSFHRAGSDTDMTWGTFECIVHASSADEVEMWCLCELISLATKSPGKAFDVGDEIYIEHIVPLESIPADGAILNYLNYRGERMAIGTMFPCNDYDCVIETYSTHDPDGPDTVEPLLIVAR